MNILIAEDDALQARELARTVETLGHKSVAIADTGRRAVELTRTLTPDLILLDIMMPGLDGIAAAREILQARPVPIIMVTGHADPALVEQAAAAGVLTYLVKPVESGALHASIQVAHARFGELEALRRQVRNLSEALEVRKVVEQAKGILMHRLRLSEDDAFRRLQRRAASERKTLREVADAVRNADRFFHEIEAETD